MELNASLIRALGNIETLRILKRENMIDEIFSCLSKREKRVLQLHFGLDGCQRFKLEELATMLKPRCSTELARRAEVRAFQKLHRWMHKFELEEFERNPF